jgi:hypothetical protein
MTAQRPSVITTLGGRTLRANEAGLVQLRADLAAGGHDWLEMSLFSRSKFASASPGDALTLQLGFEDDESDLFSGEIASVEQRPDRVVIVALAPTAALARLHRCQTYQSQTVADIVRDLAASVSIDQVDASADVSYYAVDTRRSVWGHLLDLAELSGRELSCSPSGGLRFLPISSGPATTRLRFGAELLSWRLDRTPGGSAPTFAAHGSASESGSANWHWLSSDPTSGSGEAQVIGGFHARASAEALSTAMTLAEKRRKLGGWLELLGRPELRVGDVLEVSELASGDPGPLRAKAVRHVVNATRGFRTTVRVEGAAS